MINQRQNNDQAMATALLTILVDQAGGAIEVPDLASYGSRRLQLHIHVDAEGDVAHLSVSES